MNSHFLSRRRRYAVIPAAILAVSMAGFGTSYALADEGADWTVTETPVLDSNYWLNDVESFNDGVVAVGDTDAAAPDGALGAYWDGQTWSESLLSDATALRDVAVTTAGDEAWAVGAADEDGFTAHFDGADWEPVDTPQPELGDGENATLQGVNADGSEVWAVGCAGEPDSGTPYAQAYNGKEWEIREVPVPTGYDSACLDSVEYNSATEVWMVGTAYTEDGSAPYVLSWNGEEFEEVEAPELDVRFAGFTEVTSLTVGYQKAAPVYMAGYLANEVGDKDTQPVLFEYDGQQWTQSESTQIAGRVTNMGRGTDGPWLTAEAHDGQPLLLSYQDGELREVDVPAEAATLSGVASSADADSPVWVVGSSDSSEGGSQGLAAYQE